MGRWLLPLAVFIAMAAARQHLASDADGPANSAAGANGWCRRLLAMGGGKRPGFVAVVATEESGAAWVSQLPIPAVTYDLAGNSTYDGGPVPGPRLRVAAAAYVQFVLDHYECLPPWTLFLSARGRSSLSGATGEASFHALAPATSSALVDVALLDLVRARRGSAEMLASRGGAALLVPLAHLSPLCVRA